MGCTSAIWLSWGATGVNNLFNKDVVENVTLELTSTLKLPGKGYMAGRGPYVNVAPQKYKISIVDLEYGTDYNNKYYDADKNTNGVSEKDWQCPMFWKFKAKWQKVSGPSPIMPSTSANATTKKPTGNATTKKTVAGDKTTAAIAGSTTVSNGTAAESTTTVLSEDTTAAFEDTTTVSGEATVTTTGADKETQGDKKPFPVAAIILIAVGVLIAGGAVAFFIITGKKKSA